MNADARARFACYLDAMAQATCQLELSEARNAAGTLARECGLTFDQAMKVLRSPPVDDDDPEEQKPAAEVPPEPAEAYLSTTEDDRAETIAKALAADPSRSDRDVAREIGCSPTTVGKVRAGAGLAREAREVRRGGQVYEMRLGGLSADGPATS